MGTDDDATGKPNVDDGHARAREVAVESALARFETEKQAFLGVPKSSKREVRLKALNAWNRAARDYFTLCIQSFLDTNRPNSFSNNAGYAADWLKTVADHYESVFVAAGSLGQHRKDFEPSLLKFKELQELVRLKEPQAAVDLRSRFVQVGLPTYGFEASHDRDETPTRVWIPAICLTAALLIVLVALLFKKDDISEFQRDLVSKLFAVFTGLITSFVSGTALMTLEFPVHKKVRAGFSATAGLAMFGFVWVFAPYWLKSGPPQALKPAVSPTVKEHANEAGAAQAAKEKSVALVGEFPSEQLMDVVTADQKDLTTRAAALGRLVKTKSIPDAAALQLAKTLFEKLGTVQDASLYSASESLIQDACAPLLTQKDNLAFALGEFSSHRSTFDQISAEVRTVPGRGFAPTVEQQKEMDKHQQLRNLWAALCNKALVAGPSTAFECLNDPEFLAVNLPALSGVTQYPEARIIRQMLDENVRGIKLLGARHALAEEEFREDTVVLGLARAALRAALTASGRTNSDYRLAAATFGVISGDTELARIALDIVLDEEGFRRRSAIKTVPEKSKRGVYDQFDAAVEYLKGWCQFEMYATEAEPRIRAFLEQRSADLSKMPVSDLEYGNGDDRTRACLEILSVLNRSTPQSSILLSDPTKYGGHRLASDVERRLKPETIRGVDSLLDRDEEFLRKVNLWHQKEEWLMHKETP